MGKAALLMIAAFVLTSSYQMAGRITRALDTDYQVGRHQHEVLARNAAQAGYEWAKQQLAQNFAATGTTNTYNEASYEVTATVSGNVARVISTGLTTDARNEPLRYRIVSEIERESITKMANEPPPFMRYGLITEGDLSLNGNVLVDTFRVEGDANASYNANMHTNGKLTVKGTTAVVRGFGTYVTSHAVQHPNVFQPYYNPSSEPALKRTPRIEIPAAAFNPITIAQNNTVNRTTVGPLVLAGEYDFRALGATRENPYIWHVQGALTAASDVTIHGYVLFLVDSDITISGNTKAGAYDGPLESNMAFYSGGSINFSGSGQIWGQYFAKNLINFQGSPKIYGSLTSGNSAVFGGTPNIYYQVASPALTKIWQAPEIRLKLLSYSEGW